LVRLSARQRQVLDLIADGYTEVEIAGLIGISPRTVRMHSDVLRTKLGVGRRRQLPRAFRYMCERGLLSD
jgi:DNA-binding CsgD family transcriptional regulator